MSVKPEPSDPNRRYVGSRNIFGDPVVFDKRLDQIHTGADCAKLLNEYDKLVDLMMDHAEKFELATSYLSSNHNHTGSLQQIKRHCKALQLAPEKTLEQLHADVFAAFTDWQESDPLHDKPAVEDQLFDSLRALERHVKKPQ